VQEEISRQDESVSDEELVPTAAGESMGVLEDLPCPIRAHVPAGDRIDSLLTPDEEVTLANSRSGDPRGIERSCEANFVCRDYRQKYIGRGMLFLY
jgi:hypothetical protein